MKVPNKITKYTTVALNFEKNTIIFMNYQTVLN